METEEFQEGRRARIGTCPLFNLKCQFLAILAKQSLYYNSDVMSIDQSRECWGGEYDGGALGTYCGSRPACSGVRVAVALVFLSVAVTCLKLQNTD